MTAFVMLIALVLTVNEIDKTFDASKINAVVVCNAVVISGANDLICDSYSAVEVYNTIEELNVRDTQ
jgi:phosphoribosylpyrophosphate synthetase